MSEPVRVPEWVCTLVGRLVLENEALRQELASKGAEPESEPSER